MAARGEMAAADELPKPEIIDDGLIRQLVAALASSTAPIIYVSEASSFGFYDGVASVTLETYRTFAPPASPTMPGIVTERSVAAHLRLPLSAVRSLRTALERIEELAETRSALPTNVAGRA